MSLVNVETGEIVADISADEARVLTDRIKVGVEAVWQLVVEAYERGAHRALGYSGWDDYCTREFGTSRLRLPREERQEVVASLRDSGLSIRAIAAATGMGDGTVRRSLEAGAPNGAPDEVTPIFKKNSDLWAADHDRRQQESRKVTGTDGKQYEPKQKADKAKPKRSPLPDQAQKAGWEFRRAVERLERIAEDDRFSANKEQVAAHLHGHLTYALEVCQDLLDQLDQQS